MAILLQRHHKKESKYGPSPSNNYTSGPGKKSYFKRNRNTKADHDTEELGALGGGALIAEEKHHHKKNHTNGNDMRPSHDTAMTGSTAAVPESTIHGGSAEKYGDEYAGQQQRNSGYQAYNQQGTGIAHGSAVPTTERAYGHGIHRQQGVIHDPNPYAEVHHGGLPHAATHGDVNAR